MSDTETVICCIIVSNPAGGTRPRGWQKRVNDHIRSLAKMAALRPDAAVLQEEAEIDALRLKAFRTNAAADRDAYFAAVSGWFQNRHGRALPAVQPDAEPDYCYDDEWECTALWRDRADLVEQADLTKPVPIYTLFKGPTQWAVNIPLDTDGDGEADDFELTWFDTEDAARAALKGETP